MRRSALGALRQFTSDADLCDRLEAQRACPLLFVFGLSVVISRVARRKEVTYSGGGEAQRGYLCRRVVSFSEIPANEFSDGSLTKLSLD